MNPRKDYEEKEVVSSETLKEIEEYGYCHLHEVYDNEVGQKIKITVYEHESKTYLMRFVDEKCVLFQDITARKLNH